MSDRKLQTLLQAEDSPGLLLWQISNAWQARQRAVLKPFGLTHVQFVLLATLTYASGVTQFTQKQLADYARTDTMMTSQVLRKLEQKGLVGRSNKTTDGRAMIVAPTEAGMVLANKAVGAVEAADAAFFKPLGNKAASFTDMMRVLARLYAAAKE